MSEAARAHRSGRPRWHWKRGGVELFDAEGVQYEQLDDLERGEIARLITLPDIDVVRVECGLGIVEWVSPPDTAGVWKRIEPGLDHGETWHPTSGTADLPYRAQLWRAPNGHHVIVFTNE